MNGNANASKIKPGHSTPIKETPATIRDIITVKNSLAELLIEETTLLNTMQISKVRDLQDRKLKLIGLLERYLRFLKNRPELAANAPAEDKAELQKVAVTFNKAMRKNYDTLLVARAVNGAIVKCVTQTVLKKDNNPIYNSRGAVPSVPLSFIVPITLNQTI